MKLTQLMLCALAAFFLFLLTDVAPAQDAEVAAVHVLAMGDWGANNASQREVAKAMAGYVAGSGHSYSGMFLLGDNFYIKLSGADDPLWQTMFERMYDPTKLAFPFYAALGNHDYKNLEVGFELEYAARNPQSRWKMPARWYKVELPKRDPLVTVLVLDSNQPYLTVEEWSAQRNWLEHELQSRKTAWTVCCAHHTLFSNGDHGDNGVLQREWGRLFNQYNVDFYLCGHDHDIQHLEVAGSKPSFVLAGGGGAGVRPMRVDRRGPFSRSMTGFADLSFAERTATCRLVGKEGVVVHEFTRDRDGTTRVVRSISSDVATPRTVKSITRGGEDAPAAAPTTAPASISH